MDKEIINLESWENKKIKLSVVIPCYNEAQNLSLLLERFAKAIKGDDIEVILVNNGSQDESEKVLSRLLSRYAFARTVKVEVNRGYGYGILSGLRAAKGEYLGWTHADLQADPLDVVKALGLIEKYGFPQDIFIKGNRRGRPLIDNIFTVGMGIFETIYLRCHLSDINAQPNIFHSSFFASWDNPPHDFSLDLYALYLARKQRLRIVRFPVFFKERQHGHSHWNFGWKSKLRFIQRTIDFSIKLKNNL